MLMICLNYMPMFQVIVEVAPETLYKELLTKVFRNSLVQLSYHKCGNFVVQALVSHARSQDNVRVFWLVGMNFYAACYALEKCEEPLLIICLGKHGEIYLS